LLTKVTAIIEDAIERSASTRTQHVTILIINAIRSERRKFCSHLFTRISLRKRHVRKHRAENLIERCYAGYHTKQDRYVHECYRPC